MSNKNWPIVLVVGLGLFLRVYKLASFPISLNWDEAVYGYNAYSLLTTGKDEYGKRLPLTLLSERNVMQAGYAYAALPTVEMLSLNEFSVRLPSSIFGTITILISFLIVKLMTRSFRFSLLSALLIAINPWHVQASRLALPFSASVLFLSLMVYFFILSLKQHKWFLPVAALCGALGFYMYNASVVIGPLLAFGFFWWYRKPLTKLWKPLIISAAIFLFSIVPFLKNSTSQRFDTINNLDWKLNPTFFQTAEEALYDRETDNEWLGRFLHNRRLVVISEYTKNYFRYWDFNFLFLDSSNQRMFYNTNLGLFYAWELPLFLWGLYLLLKTKKQWSRFLLWWLLIAPAAAALVLGAPIAWRSLTFLPVMSIVIAFGLVKLLKRASPFMNTLVVAVLAVLSSYYFWHQYTVHSPVEYAAGFRDGNKQLAEFLSQIENEYDRIVITTDDKIPYMYLAFYQQRDPQWIQAQTDYPHYQKIGKYEFRDINWEEDLNLKNTLLVSRTIPEKVELGRVIKTISRRDDSIAYVIVEPQPR